MADLLDTRHCNFAHGKQLKNSENTTILLAIFLEGGGCGAGVGLVISKFSLDKSGQEKNKKVKTSVCQFLSFLKHLWSQTFQFIPSMLVCITLHLVRILDYYLVLAM